jgi:glutathione S-transferase
MKLYYFEALMPRKACAVATHVGSPVEFVYVDPAKREHKAPPYLAINPNGVVPALTDGDMTLWESDAIMCHLAKSAGSDLWPSDNRQVEVMKWLSWNAQHFTRHGGELYFQNLVRPHLGEEPDSKRVADATRGWLPFAQVLDTHLRDRSYLVGETPTIADFSVAVALPYAERAKIPVERFPNIIRWHDRLNTLPAWRAPFPRRELVH